MSYALIFTESYKKRAKRFAQKHPELTRMFHKLTRVLTCLLINKKDFVQSGVSVTTPLHLKTSLLIKILRDHHANL